MARDLGEAIAKGKERGPGIPAEQTFVAQPATPKEPIQRTTLDLPVSLHRKFKLRSITHGPSMADMITEAMQKYSEGWE